MQFSLLIPLSFSQGAALVLPILLIASMFWLFSVLTRRLGHPLGYLLSFGVYWVLWCILAPLALLGGVKPLLALFTPFPSPGELSWQTHLALWWPVIFPLFFVFIRRAAKANARILIASVLLGIVIGVTEEILWRGVYMRLFPGSIWLNMVYPSLMFALWHLAPLSVVKNRQAGGATSFVVYAFLLGITYAITVNQTGSIAWATVSHVVHDSLGLGGFAYSAWLDKK